MSVTCFAGISCKTSAVTVINSSFIPVYGHPSKYFSFSMFQTDLSPNAPGLSVDQ